MLKRLKKLYFKYIVCDHKSRELIRNIPTYYGAEIETKCLVCGRKFSR